MAETGNITNVGKRKRYPDLTYDTLIDRLSYDPETGFFTWRATGSHGPKTPKHLIGKKAGCYSKSLEYAIIRIGGKFYPVHRLAFLYMKGRWPEFFLDHKDGNPLNNRWDNLREATKSQNSANRRISSNNRSGFKGVVESPSGLFESRVQHLKKNTYLGLFKTAEEAHRAYCEACASIFGEFANPG
jgi:hypothetical protein